MLDTALDDVAKQLVRQSPNRPSGTAFAEMARLSFRMFISSQGQDGMVAFREKRLPAWVLTEDRP